MAGLGIRYTELASVLASEAEVTVATGDPGGLVPGVRVVGYQPHRPAPLHEEIAAADAVVAPPQWPLVTRWLARSGARIIYDLYDPETLETLELFSGRRRSTMVALTLDRLLDALRTGHHFMCASETQRDLWIGAMLASRLLTPAVYDRDPTLRDRLDLVPFGVPVDPPRAGGPGIRAAFPQIGPEERIVLWNGGLWRWLDPATAVRAVGRLSGVRLVFMGASAKAAAADVRELADGMGNRLLFNEDWVPYEDRAAWLLEADCALVTAIDHLETRFAFRTRMLDCFWAGLPVVCTRGDQLADRVSREGLGAVVEPGDDAALADAIASVLDRGREAYAGGLSRAAAEFTWPVVAEPLRRWIRSSDLPPRLGGARRPLHALRSGAYVLARRAFATARLRPPSV